MRAILSRLFLIVWIPVTLLSGGLAVKYMFHVESATEREMSDMEKRSDASDHFGFDSSEYRLASEGYLTSIKVALGLEDEFSMILKIFLGFGFLLPLLWVTSTWVITGSVINPGDRRKNTVF
jgi:hypothetical protein